MKNSKVVKYLLQNQDKIHWFHFSGNKNTAAVDYLIQNPDKIDWNWFSSNPSIFEFDQQRYEKVIARL